MGVAVALTLAIVVGFGGSGIAPVAVAAIPGENGLIAAVGDCENGVDGIVLMQPDGSERRCLVSALDMPGRFPYGPEWSPDGSLIAFSGGDGSTASGEIYITTMEGEVSRLTNNEVPDRLSTWTPDGKRLVFERGLKAIFIMDADGTNVELIEKRALEPSLSPDGRRVAFSWSYEIITVDIHGEHRHQLTESIRNTGYPAWSPNGRRIVFVRGSAGSLVVMRRDGTHEQQVTDRMGDSEPTWSPDGKSLLFVRGFYDADPRLYSMRLSDGDLTLISDGDLAPDWQSL